MIGTTAALIAAGLSAAGSLGGAALAGRGANRAADTQARAAEAAAARQQETDKYVADLQKQAADEALGYQRESRDQARSDLAPWMTAGKGALEQIVQLLGPEGMKDWTGKFAGPSFNAPAPFDPNTVQADPAFGWRLAQGQQAMERGAAARGNLLSGGTAKALERYAQNYSSDEFDRAYNRSYGRYSDQYARDYGRYSDDWNRSLQEYLQGYGEFRNTQGDKFSRLSSLAGLGQNATNTVTQAGQVAGTNMANIGTGAAAEIGRLLSSGTGATNQALQAAAAARAQGQASGAEAWGGALNNVGQLGMLLALLNRGKTTPLG